MNLASGESATITLREDFILSLPGYGTTLKEGKDGMKYLITTNSDNNKFAVAPFEAVEGIWENWKKGDYIPMQELSPEDLCCAMLQEDKGQYFAAFVLPKKFLGLKQIGWLIKWTHEEESQKLYKNLFITKGGARR